MTLQDGAFVTSMQLMRRPLAVSSSDGRHDAALQSCVEMGTDAHELQLTFLRDGGCL